MSKDESLLDRFRGVLLGVAIGDALGARFEGQAMCDPASLSAWVDAPPHPLTYTDDTNLTLATARSLVECRGFEAEHLAESLAIHYEREPWRGHGAGPPRVFDDMRHGKRWDTSAQELFGGAGSFGNGAATRAAPIALLHFSCPRRAVDVARAAARITHAHPIGQDGAGFQAGAIAELLSLVGARRLEVASVVQRLRPHAATRRFADLLVDLESLDSASHERIVRVLGNGVEAHRSVITALHAFLRHPDSFARTVLFAVSLGGDAHTIASMAAALSGAFLGASAIPSGWAEQVEGHEDLTDLAEELFDLATADG